MLNNDNTTSGAAPVEEKPKRKAKEKGESVNQKQLCVEQLLLARFKDADTPILYHEPSRNKAAGGKTSGCFWKWSGKVWEPVSDRLLKQHVHTHGLQAGEKITRSFVDSVLDLARNEAYRAGHEFDRDRSGINVQNGTLQWSGTAWEMNPHCREEYRTVMLPIVYDPSATAPRFNRFLAEIFAPDDDKDEKSRLILEAIGYSLTTSTDLERFFILAGDGANGKSILLALLENLVGEDNASAVQPNQFDNRFQRAHLHRKYINVVTELTVGAELPDDSVKGVVSGDRMTVEHKMQAPFDFKPFCTLWIGTNHIPTTRDFSDAIFRRTMIIPFNRKFEPEERENRQHLIDSLTSEASGILNMALDAYAKAIQRKDFTLPPSVKDAVEEWREDADPVKSFYNKYLIKDERCTGQDAVASVVIYEKFMTFCEGDGVKVPAQRDFTKRLCKIAGIKTSHTKKARTIVGIRPLTDEEIEERLKREEAGDDVPF